MKILITGASGFIGSFIVEEALSRGMEVWAAVRSTSSLQYLQDDRIHLIELDMQDTPGMTKIFREHRFDYVVHAAGATKCVGIRAFYKTNTIGTKNLADAILASQTPIRKFVFISSLSVLGPINEQEPYTEMRHDDLPSPDTAYAKSKLLAEEYLDGITTQTLPTGETLNGLPCVTLRPTGVYGPRERDYYIAFKSIRNRIDFAAGLRPQNLTFIYVKDLVQAVFLSLDKGIIGHKYLLSDGQVYSTADFTRLIKEALGIKKIIHITCPLSLLRGISYIGEIAGKITGKPRTLNTDKYKIMKQRNWRCNISLAKDELGYAPEYDLKKGIALTVDWYKKHKWL